MLEDGIGFNVIVTSYPPALNNTYIVAIDHHLRYV